MKRIVVNRMDLFVIGLTIVILAVGIVAEVKNPSRVRVCPPCECQKVRACRV